MKTFVAAAGLAASASAAVLPRQDQCCFGLTASGEQSGQVGQLGDGQNRIGGSHPAGQYCLTGSSITDGNGRGCILTPPTTQFQCDEGATPDSGFSVSDSGQLQHNGDSNFYACAADEGEYNIYTEQSDDQTQCVEITLNTGAKCGGSGSGSGESSAPASQPASSAATSPASPETSAPGYSALATSPASTEISQPTETAPGYSASGYSAPETSPASPETTQPGTGAPSSGVVIITSTVCSCSEGPSSRTSGVPIPSESQSAESQPVDTQPVPSQPAEYSSQSVSSQPAETQTVATPPAGYSSEPGESEAIPTPPAGTQPVPSQPAGYSSQPGESQPFPTQPAGYSSKPGASDSVPSQPVGSPSGPSQPAGYTSQPGTETASTGSQPVGTQSPEYSSHTATPTQSPGDSTSGSGSACQTSLVTGSYETPHLILPVNSESPNQSYGSSYNAYINNENSTVFNFDIPQSDEGKTCSLVFLFPKKDDLETTDYTFNGQGSIEFAQLSSAVDESTTYSSCPSTQQDLGSVTPHPGGSYVVQSGACAAGTTETIQMTASGGLELEFFEDWNPSPLGLFITTC